MDSIIDFVKSFIEKIASSNQAMYCFVYVPLACIFLVIILFLLKRLAVSRLKKWALRTSSRLDDIIIESIAFPSNFLILASGIALFIYLLPLMDRIDKVATIVLQGCVVFAIVVFLDKFLLSFLREHASKKGFGKMSYGITKGLARGFILGLGALIFLDLIGISITPILASLGIGSLAVALALQDTLSNFFAGIYVAVDRPVQVGDLVRLEGGQEGYITDIGWRSTRICTFLNNVVIIPNAKLMGGVITNYHLPDKEVPVLVEVGVHYDSDLHHVERVTCEVACETMKRVAGGIPSFEPFMRYHTFGDFSIDFTVVLRAKELADSKLIQHEFIKMLYARYRKENISIPYPIRTLEISDQLAEKFPKISSGK